MARSPQQQALRDRNKAIKNPVKGSRDSSYTLDKKDEKYYHVKYIPLRSSKVVNKSRVVELEDAAYIQKHSKSTYEELQFRKFFDRKDIRAVVLHDPTVESKEELTPQQKAAITRKENEERKKAEEGQ